MAYHFAVGAKTHDVFLLESDIHALQCMAELLVGDGQCPRQLDDIRNLILLEHPVVAIGKLMHLEDTAVVLLDDEGIDQVEVQIFQTRLLLKGHDIGHLSGHHRLIACATAFVHVIALALDQAEVLCQQVASSPVGIAEQVDHRLLVLCVTHQQWRSVFMNHEHLVRNVLPACVHIERGAPNGGDTLDLVVFEVLQSDSGTHLTVCTHSGQLHVEAYLPLASPFVGDVQDDIVEVEVHLQEVRHLLLIAVDERLGLRRVQDVLLGIERLREVHLTVFWREGRDRIEPLVVYQCGIEGGDNAGEAETHVVSLLAFGDHHLCGHFGILTQTRVVCQDLQPLGIYVSVGLHCDASRLGQQPVVVSVQ